MSHASLSATVSLTIMQQDQLTAQLSDIMGDITMATRQSSKTSNKEATALSSLKAEYAKAVADPKTYAADYAKYQDEKDDLEKDFQCELSKITEWESELETQKSTLETEIQATSAYKDSFTSLLKTNIQKDYKYGEAAGGASS